MDEIISALKDPLPVGGVILWDLIAEARRILINKALKQTEGSIAGSAKLLGLQRTTLVEMMKKHGLNRYSYREDECVLQLGANELEKSSEHTQSSNISAS